MGRFVGGDAAGVDEGLFQGAAADNFAAKALAIALASRRARDKLEGSLLADEADVGIFNTLAGVSDFFEAATLRHRLATPTTGKLAIRAAESTAAWGDSTLSNRQYPW
jgi:hypothetical protein